MRVTLVDDSIPFDGDTPVHLPLGAAEKAFAYLAGALAKAGHQVTAINRILTPGTFAGAEWPGWSAPRAPDTDILIAFRKPDLLRAVPKAGRKLLWLWGDTTPLTKLENRAFLVSEKPTLIYLSRAHLDSFDDPDRLRAGLIQPGVGDAFLLDEQPQPENPPHAVVTAHPLHGVEWLVDLWEEKIHPIAPSAELRIYSAALTKGLAGDPVSAAFGRVLQRVRETATANVRVLPPEADPGMAAAFRKARVHLHPGHHSDFYGHTILESQSCGLPAVVRPRGNAKDRVIDKVTGFVEDDDNAFANAALRLLNDPATYEQKSRIARQMQRGRRWTEVAADFESQWG